MIDRSSRERGNAAFYIVVISLGIAAILLVEREWVLERVESLSTELTARSPAGLQTQAALDASPLRLSNPQPSLVIIGGVRTLVASGFITNLTDAAQPVPNVKLLLVDQDNTVVHETSAAPSSDLIDPNSSIPYRIEVPSPVESAIGLKVEFD